MIKSRGKDVLRCNLLINCSKYQPEPVPWKTTCPLNCQRAVHAVLWTIRPRIICCKSSPWLRLQCKIITFTCLVSFLFPVLYHCDKITLRNDLKSSWPFLVLLQLQRRPHKALFRSDYALFMEFPEGKLFWLTDNTNTFAPPRPQGLVGLLNRKDHQPTSESFPLSCQSAGQPLQSELTPS